MAGELEERPGDGRGTERPCTHSSRPHTQLHRYATRPRRRRRGGHTGAAPGHTHPGAGTRARPQGRLREGATLARSVYLLICINERLYQPPPRLGARAAAFVLGAGRSVPGDPHGGVPPTLRETIVHIYLKLGGLGLSEERGLHSQQLEKADGRERERGNPAGS